MNFVYLHHALNLITMVSKLFQGYQAILVVFFITSCSVNFSDNLQKGLEGHWQFNGNVLDISGNDRHAVQKGNVDFFIATGNDFQATGVILNGTDAWLEVPSGNSPVLGKDDFSISVWVNINQDGFILGDILSHYDNENNTGFNLSLKTNAVTTSLANYQQLSFGIDSGRESQWTDHGRPGNALSAFALASFNGSLYAGTTHPGKDESGKVFKLSGNGEWTDCGSPDKSNSVMALAVFHNQLYAGTGKYRLAGSAQPESENLNLGGRILRYDGGDNWTYCGRLPYTEAIGGMIEYKGYLYATSLYHPAGFFRYDGDTTWVDCGTPDGKRVVALGVYNGFIFATSYDGGKIYRYDGTSWIDAGQLGDNTQTYSFAVYYGELYVGTWPSGRVYRYKGINQWADVGRLGDELEVMGMLVHNGRLIAGTLPLAEIYAYEGDTTWMKLTRLDHTPDVRYRRAWTMAEHNGKVYCSTLPSGKIFSFEQGKNVLCPDPFKEGWNHVAATRSKNQLSVFINGIESCKSVDPDIFSHNLNNRSPLRIGFGPNSYFNGKIAEVRIYSRNLTPKEIRFLADPENH